MNGIQNEQGTYGQRTQGSSFPGIPFAKNFGTLIFVVV